MFIILNQISYQKFHVILFIEDSLWFQKSVDNYGA